MSTEKPTATATVTDEKADADSPKDPSQRLRKEAGYER
jgi:hypothetical protein